jgi:hypothetical protein
MTEDQLKALHANTLAINAMSDEELLAMLKSGKCPREPEHLQGVPLGMFHCEVCGMMVLAGLPHPPIAWIGDDLKTGYADYPDTPDTFAEVPGAEGQETQE